MKDKKASWSAEFVAAYRAAESNRPPEQRVCYDPYAKDFLSLPLTLISKSQLLTRFALWYASHRRFPGAIGMVVARVRFIDDYLEECIDKGIKQLVIIGAGYDSRAYRFPKLKEVVKVFELDHPLTQRVKIEKVRSIFHSLPDYVVYVPVDFQNDKIDSKLLESGYDSSLKTLFIWEGVTMYITENDVNETLAFVVKNSGKGSSIVFDYIFQSVIDRKYDSDVAKRLLQHHVTIQEPFTFGIQEKNVEKFLIDRGFSHVNNTTPQALKSIYFKGRNQKRKVFQFWGFAHATV